MTRSAEPQIEGLQHLPVSVILARRNSHNPWTEHVWSAVGITVGTTSGNREPEMIREDAEGAYYLFGGFEVTLHADECESYYYNLVSDSPRAYILAHADSDAVEPVPFRVSMSFDEAHAYLEGEDQIYAVDVPAELYRWTEAFVIAHYFPERKRKRKLRDWSADEAETHPR